MVSARKPGGALLYNPGARTLPVVMTPRVQATARPAANGVPTTATGKGGDEEMMEVSQRVPIFDPISLCRIERPVRGRNCSHLGVFDREPYIEFNEMMEKTRCRLSKLWNCPLCGNPVKEKDLQPVEAFEQVLAAARSLPDITHVDVLPDGTLALPRDAGDTIADDDDPAGANSSGSGDESQGPLTAAFSGTQSQCSWKLTDWMEPPTAAPANTDVNGSGSPNPGPNPSANPGPSTDVVANEVSNNDETQGGTAVASPAVATGAESDPKTPLKTAEAAPQSSTEAHATTGARISQFFSRDRPSPRGVKRPSPVARTSLKPVDNIKGDGQQQQHQHQQQQQQQEEQQQVCRTSDEQQACFLRALDGLQLLAFSLPRPVPNTES